MANIDISRIKSERILHDTKLGIIEDFYETEDPDIDTQIALDNIDYSIFPYLARALCLYSALLVTKLHETNAKEFNPYYTERKTDAVASLSALPKYAGLSVNELSAKADEIVMREIRNCFAHGNFEISYSKGTDKLFFVLRPAPRSEIVSTAPIVISAKDVTRALKSHISVNAIKYKYMLESFLSHIENRLDKSLKELMLPVQMLKLADYYEDSFKTPKSETLCTEKVYSYLQYVLLSTMITYEQDEYYEIYGRDDKIFKVISLIRNSLAHDNTNYTEMATKMEYKDKTTTLTEDIGVSCSKMLIIESQKEALKHIISKNEHSPEAIAGLKEDMQKIFDMFFESGYSFEEMFNGYCEVQEELKANKNK